MRGISTLLQSTEDFNAQLRFLDVVLGQVPTSPYQPCLCCQGRLQKLDATNAGFRLVLIQGGVGWAGGFEKLV